MIGRDLVRPLGEDWRETLDGVARARGWPTSGEPARLAAKVAALSESYNDPARARAAVKDAGAARLGFSFARDVPKGAAAVREIVAAGTVSLGAPLRVLDLGAGLGATTWGVARALEAAGSSGVIDATWVDRDAEALELAGAIVRARQGRGTVQLRATSVSRDVGAFNERKRFDLVLAGQVLSELDVGLDSSTRTQRHAALLTSWLDQNVDEHGALVVVEPALRDRTRHLHRVRDALVTQGVTVFAPCLHMAPCPALLRETDWCHEDVPVDLPAWLVPVARAAGLRHEGLTFSYLVLRKDGLRLTAALAMPPSAAALRVVSDAMPSKGKREAFLCGEFQVPAGRLAARTRAARLNRDAAPSNDSWDELARGDVLVVDPALELDRPRIGREASVQGGALSRGEETR